MAVNGNTLLIYRGSTLIAGTKSLRIQSESDVIETSTTASTTWKTFIEGRGTWTASCDYLLADTSASTVITNGLALKGQTFTLKFYTRSTSGTLTQIAAGAAICTRCTIEATRGALARGSFEFQGSGALAIPT